MADNNPDGLGNDEKWLEFDPSQSVMDRLLDDDKFHSAIKSYLLKRLKTSEQKMSQFYDRWRANERKLQAYITLPKYEQLLKEMNDSGKPPSPVSITIPYAYATIWTIVTYLIHTFAGRTPIFQVQPSKGESVGKAKNMETVLQWNADQTRLVAQLCQFFLDGEVYGVAIFRNLWTQRFSKRSRFKKMDPLRAAVASILGHPTETREKIDVLVFEGNDTSTIDPFLFFPDPNVPMWQVNKKGEFVFWRSFQGKHALLAAEGAGQIAGMDKVDGLPRGDSMGNSARGLLANGDGTPGFDLTGRNALVNNYFQVDQGSVEIIPAELGLGESKTPEKWLFTIVNKSRVVQAEPLDCEHDMHPVAVSEPTSMGYGFGQPGSMDFLGPIQDTMSWLLNSHMHNTRAALNNSFIVDPSMVELQDLRSNEPGKLIRLKRAAFGQDVRQVFQQLQVTDVTSGHINNIEAMQRIGDAVAAVSDNLRGIQDSGGRKTATEVRTSTEAGASRLAAKATLISAQAIVDLTEQMSINLQANMSQEVYLSIVGAEGINEPIAIKPQDIVGDFYYPVHDGTLPIDKVALVDVWKEILLAVAGDQQLRSQYNLGSIFEFVAKLGGATNIEQFKVQVAEPGAAPPPGAVPIDQVPIGAPSGPA